MTDSNSSEVNSAVQRYLDDEEAKKYGPAHALWKALDDSQPLQVLIGIVETDASKGGFGGPNGKAETTKYTPLHCAAQRGSMELAKVLIAQGADINAKTYEDFTPLDFAEHVMKYPELVEFLKASGGKPGSENC